MLYAVRTFLIHLSAEAIARSVVSANVIEKTASELVPEKYLRSAIAIAGVIFINKPLHFRRIPQDSVDLILQLALPYTMNDDHTVLVMRNGQFQVVYKFIQLYGQYFNILEPFPLFTSISICRSSSYLGCAGGSGAMGVTGALPADNEPMLLASK